MKKIAACGALMCALIALTVGAAPAIADALGGKEPWNFTPVNRAGLAVVIKNVEDGNGTGGAGSGGGTTVVCGGTSGGSGDGSSGAGSSATANNTCVIVNNSDGAIVDVDQDSDGNQSSSSTSQTSSTTNNNPNQPRGSIDDVAAILNGRSQ